MLAKEKFGLLGGLLELGLIPARTHVIPFSAQTRMSGIDLTEPQRNGRPLIRNGSADAITATGGTFPPNLTECGQIDLD